jgi:hypothetical protein
VLARQPGQVVLIQGTGLPREINLEEAGRRTPENEAVRLERTIASSFIQGSGALQRLWNTDSYLTQMELHDKLTGRRVTWQLSARRTALALIGRQANAVLAKYGY